MRLSCSTHSATSCVWAITLRLFMIRTIDASIAYLRSLSTSSTTFFFSSTGGRGICKLCEYAIRKHHIDSLYSYKYGTKQIKLEKTRKYLDPSHPVSKFWIELERIIGRNSSTSWFFAKNLVFRARERMEQTDNIIIWQVQLCYNLRVTKLSRSIEQQQQRSLPRQ